MEVTKKQTLLECLEIMRKFRNCFSHKGWGMAPIDRYQALFAEYDKKCKILEDMIHALDSETVRMALANWQKEIMEGFRINMKIDEDDSNPINGPLVRKDEGRDQEENGDHYPEERGIPAGEDPVQHGPEMDGQPVQRLENAGQGSGGEGGAEDRRDYGAV